MNLKIRLKKITFDTVVYTLSILKEDNVRVGIQLVFFPEEAGNDNQDHHCDYP
jgi:hypothetical protein